MATKEVSSAPSSVAFIHNFLDERKLDPYEFRIYCHMVRRTGGKPDGVCFATLKKTAEICQMSVRKAQQAIKVLIQANFLSQNKRKGRTDEYRVLPASEWAKSEELEAIRKAVISGKAKKMPDLEESLQMSELEESLQMSDFEESLQMPDLEESSETVLIDADAMDENLEAMLKTISKESLSRIRFVGSHVVVSNDAAKAKLIEVYQELLNQAETDEKLEQVLKAIQLELTEEQMRAVRAGVSEETGQKIEVVVQKILERGGYR